MLQICGPHEPHRALSVARLAFSSSLPRAISKPKPLILLAFSPHSSPPPPSLRPPPLDLAAESRTAGTDPPPPDVAEVLGEDPAPQSTAASWPQVSASSSTPSATDVLGPPLQPPPPPPLVLVGLSSVPSPLPSDPQSLSIGSSLAIVFIIVIATAIVTICIVLLRRGCRRRNLSCSSLSPRCSFSPMDSFSLSSAESGLQSGTSAAVCALPRGRAVMSSLEMVVVPSARKEAGKALDSASVSRSAERPVKGTELAAASSAVAVIGMSGVLVPSAPPLPEVERLILELLVLPALDPGKSMVCLICNSESPTDVTLVLPVCSHVFHQSCIVTWLRCTALLCCPSCHASITIPGQEKTNFCSDEYDIESQMLVPATPGEDVVEAVGGSRGLLRSSLNRLSGSLMGCSSNHATAVVVPVCLRSTTGSSSLCSSGRLGNDSYCVEEQMTPSIPPSEEVSEVTGGSRRWLRSLAALSGSWIGFSRDCPDPIVLPVYSKPTTKTMASSDHSSMDSQSRRWDVEAATPIPEKPSVYDNIKWFFRT